MAKENGIGMTCTVDDSAGTPRTLTNDITNLAFTTPRGIQDITGLDKSAYERLLLLADGTVTLNAVFNDAANQMHDTFKSIPTSSVSRTVVIAVSGQTMTMECMLSDYPLTRAADGSLTASVPGSVSNGTAPTWT